MVGYEGRKLRMKNARSTIAELLQKEEERHKQGEIKKIERDAGKGVVEKLQNYIQTIQMLHDKY